VPLLDLAGLYKRNKKLGCTKMLYLREEAMNLFNKLDLLGEMDRNNNAEAAEKEQIKGVSIFGRAWYRKINDHMGVGPVSTD